MGVRRPVARTRRSARAELRTPVTRIRRVVRERIEGVAAQQILLRAAHRLHVRLVRVGYQELWRQRSTGTGSWRYSAQ